MSGKIKSMPHVPGKTPVPNSAPDSSTPNHLNLPVVVGEAAADVAVVAVVVARVVLAAVVVAVPGRHCE